METNDKRPNAALINREWYDNACKVLNPDDLGRLLICVVEYVLDGTKPTRLRGNASVVFTMILSALDSDIAKYRERCERNASNAKRQQQRVVASETQSQQVGANTTSTTTSTTTTTSTSTPSLSTAETEEKERWLVYGYFWSTASRAIKEELNAFWSYYESLGWKNNKGAPIMSKLAAARMWKRQFELGVAPDGAEAWFKAVQTCPVTDYNIWHAFAGAERQNNAVIVRLKCSRDYLGKLQKVVPTMERDLRTLWRAQEINFECPA